MNREAVVLANEWGNQAFAAGQARAAAEAYQRAIALLDPRETGLNASLYENLGLARLNLRQLDAALRAFLRALDGDPASRQQSLRYLVVCCQGLGRYQDALRYLAIYERCFGVHPDVQRAALQQRAERARRERALWQVG